jgi:catechol 2,3-dioxygenase-like lactoylglutathione lyase family enzyme
MRGIHHVGITVRELERSLAFYRDLLGAVVIGLSDDVDVAAVVGLPGARARIADLDIGGGQILELLEYRPTAPADNARDANRPDTIGTCHVSLRVADLDQALARVARAGFAPIGEAVRLDEGGIWQDCVVVYLHDPDGVIVELLQQGSSGQGSNG